MKGRGIAVLRALLGWVLVLGLVTAGVLAGCGVPDRGPDTVVRSTSMRSPSDVTLARKALEAYYSVDGTVSYPEYISYVHGPGSVLNIYVVDLKRRDMSGCLEALEEYLDVVCLIDTRCTRKEIIDAAPVVAAAVERLGFRINGYGVGVNKVLIDVRTMTVFGGTAPDRIIQGGMLWMLSRWYEMPIRFNLGGPVVLL